MKLGIHSTQESRAYNVEYTNSMAAKSPVMHGASQSGFLHNFAITMKTGNASKMYLVIGANFNGPPVIVRYGNIRTPSANIKSEEGNHFR